MLKTVIKCMALFLCTLSQPVYAVSGLSSDEMKLINEAVVQIRTHSLIPPKSTTGMTEDIIRSYSHNIDEYTDFLTSKEYAAFLESTNSDYFGVEMDIQKKTGRVYLYPFKDGRAEKNGIKAGDELIAVNGAPVYGKSVFLVGSHIRGEEGTTVQLTTRTGNGIPRVQTLRRQNTSYASVSSHTSDQAHYIEIARFTRNTAELLKENLDKITTDSKTIIIDLRQNQGGSLRVAGKCADFFLESGTVLFRLRSRDATKDVVAELPQLTDRRLLLIQDKSTASAAEAFIAALVQNERAVSVGQKTYGKGLAQRFLPLSNGSALLLTYAEILTPYNVAYNNQGLEPDKILPSELMKEDFSQDESLQKLLDFVEIIQE